MQVTTSQDERLQELEAQLEAVLTTHAFIEFTPDGQIVNANENFLNAMGYTLSEIQGQHHRMFVDAEYGASPEYMRFWDDLKRGIEQSGEFERRAKGGRLIWIEGSYNALRNADGDVSKVVKYARDITDRKAHENEIARMRSLVENAPINIMCADREGKIEYLNPSSVKTLKELEEHLPVRVEEIVGQSFDIFHRDPSHQRNLVRDQSALPISSEIKVGDQILDLLVSPMFGADGSYAGPMVTWEVVTERRKQQDEVARMRSIVENAPINIMCADREGTIEYLNPSSKKTLQSLQQHLPIPVEDIVGSSFDVFHQNPSRQRQLVQDQSSLPVSAHITVADETLDLLVSPMFGADGSYIGPMATWEVITERLRRDKELADSQERERQAAQELEEKVDAMLGVVQAAAEGDLARAVPVSGDDAIGQMGAGLERLLASLRESMRGISENASALAGASEELNATAQQMSASSERTSAQAEVVSGTSRQVGESVQTVASGTEELSASISEIARSATGAADVAKEAVHVAQEANSTISKLGDSSTEIGQVIKVITSIAQQTNLLALNATIEAARAGEAGKGFAVVANEVKELAKETAKATEDISRKIETIQTDTSDAVGAIEKISGIIGQINDTQSTIASAVEEQSATTNEMARSVAEANTGTQEIVQSIGSVAEAAQDSSRGSAGVQDASAELSKMAASLQELVTKFTI